MVHIDIITLGESLVGTGERVIRFLQFQRRVSQHVWIRRGSTHGIARFYQGWGRC